MPMRWAHDTHRMHMYGKGNELTYINQVCEINEVDDTLTPLNPEGNNEGNGGGLTPESQSHPNDPPCDPSVPSSPQPGMTDPNGCPTVTMPNIEFAETEETKTDCERNEKTDDSAIRYKMGSIKYRVAMPNRDMRR